MLPGIPLNYPLQISDQISDYLCYLNCVMLGEHLGGRLIPPSPNKLRIYSLASSTSMVEDEELNYMYTEKPIPDIPNPYGYGQHLQKNYIKKKNDVANQPGWKLPFRKVG